MNFEVALAVLREAIEEGVADADVPGDEGERRRWAEGRRWDPVYVDYEYSDDGLV